MSSTQSIIQLGLDLLRNRRIDVGTLQSYSDVFSKLEINTSNPLELSALESIFFDPTAVSSSTPKFYTPSELNPNVINYPDQENASIDFFNVLPPDDLSIDSLVLLERYGSFVATSANPRLPVYDLFKTAAAIQDCLANGDTGQECVLVGCDFSGIQDTVYTITSKGALKTLRARSFMLELLTEHIIYEILRVVNAGRHAITYSGGGGFCLLLPNRNIVREDKEISIKGVIEEYTDVLNQWALKEFLGRFFIAIDVHSFSIDDLTTKEKFQTLRQAQADNLDRLKRRKFINQLDDLFKSKMPEQLTVQTECQITRRDDLENDQMRDIGLQNGEVMSKDNKNEDGCIWVSESSFHQFNLGDRLVNAASVYRYLTKVDMTKKENFGTLVFPGINDNDVFYAVHELTGAKPEIYSTINSWDGGFVFQYAKYVRKHGELSLYAQSKEKESLIEDDHEVKPKDTASFQGLASSSCGADLIGALRMDVDNMGDLFREIEKLTELSAKSRLLNLFFKVYLNQICGERKTDIVGKNKTIDQEYGKPGRNVSVIYAGGDDLFIVGAWDETVELSFDIQLALERFTQGGLSITGGLTLHQPKFPLYQMARRSAEAEKFAKHDTDRLNEKATKNRLALFFDDSKLQRYWHLGDKRFRYMLSMNWGLGHVFLIPLIHTFCRCGNPKQRKDGRKFFEIEKFSFSTVEKWFSIIEKYQDRHLLYLPTMARVMRGIEDEFYDNTELFERLVSYLYTRDSRKENWISHLHIALNWLAYLRREM